MEPLPPGFQLDQAQSQKLGFPVAVNPSTGKRMRFRAPEGGAGGANAGLKPAPPEWGQGAFVLPNGEVRRRGPRGGFEKLGDIPGMAGADTSPDIKEFQANASARATLMDQGQTDYNKAVSEGYNPTSLRNQLARGIEGNRLGNYLSDVVRDDVSERARAAELQFVDGALRTTTGANAPEPEVVRANRAYFRQPGEGAGVEPNKAALRGRFRDQAVRIAGPAYIQPEAKQARGALPQAARNAYQARLKAGTIDQKAPRGTQANPYLARDQATLDRLPPGTYVFAPDGSFGVIE